MNFFRPDLKRYKKITSNLKEGSVLNLGSDDSDLHNFLLENHNGKVVGLDIVNGDNIDIQMDLNEGIPLSNRSFDNVVAGELIEHIDSPLKFLRDIKRVLKNNGKLILTTPNMTGLQHILYDYGSLYGEKHAPHLYSWNKLLLTRIIKKAGLDIEKKRRIHFILGKKFSF